MTTSFQSFRNSRRAQILAAVGVLVAAGLTVGAGQRWATSHIIQLAADAGVEVRRADVSVSPGGSVTFRNLTWTAGALSAVVESVEVEVALLSLFSTPQVEKLVVTGVDVTQSRARSAASTGAPSMPRNVPALIAQLLARLGGTPPHVVVDRAQVTATVDAGQTARFAFDHGEGRVDGAKWRFVAPTTIALPPIDGIAIPGSGAIEATMTLAEETWSLDTAGLRFAEPAKLAGPGGLRVSVGAVGITGRGAALLSDVVVDHAFGVAGPLVIARIEAGPLGAVAARDPSGLGFVRATGADITLRRPSGSARGGVGDATPPNWNDEVSPLLARAFDQADAALARGADKLGSTKLIVTDAVVRVPDLDSTLTIGEASVQREKEGSAVRVSAAWRQGKQERGRVALSYAPHRRRVDLVTEDFQLAALEGLARMKLSGVMSANVSIVQAKDESGRLTYPLQGRVHVDGLRFEKALLAADPIEVAPVDLDFAASYDPAGVFETSKASFQVGEVQIDVRPAVWGLEALPAALPTRIEVQVDLEATPVQRIFEAIPPAILGPLTGAEFEGSFALHGRVDLPLQAAERLKWELEPELTGFRIVSLPHDVDVRRLMTSATYTLTDEKIGHKRTVFVPALGSPPTEWTGAGGDCGSYAYVPLHQISPHLASGVLSTEDRGFLWHDGFNAHALRESLAANLAEGRIVRGGSTITMQLVKNLFLDRRQTVARKLREVFLVWLTESVVEVPKARLLEVYFNVIEYGPRITGIWHGSTYFFGRHPRDLSVGEAAWFITTLSGPKIYHHQFLKRQISDNVWGRMRTRIAMLYHNDYITELDYVEATARPPAFRATDSGCGPNSGAPRPSPGAETEVIAAELLRLRRAGVAREEVSARSSDPLWRERTLAAPRQGAIDWDALPLARDRYSWWARR